MFLCGGKKQKVQMRTIPLESHMFTLKNNTEDILKIQYNADKLSYESQDKEMLIKGKKLQEMHQFNEATLLQQIDDQLIDIEKAKEKKKQKVEDIYQLEREILQIEIEISVLQHLIDDDQRLVKNLENFDVKFAQDIQEKYKQSLEGIDEEFSQRNPQTKEEKTDSYQNLSQYQKRSSSSKTKLISEHA